MSDVEAVRMIWFACKQCGKRHGRADGLAGTLVFCTCGQGNRVPWTSTAPEPDAPPAPPRTPTPPEPPLPLPEPDVSPRPRREARRPNPAYCLKHLDTESARTCDACRCSFCAACVITMQGQTLCGPCKNFRTRGMQRPPHMLPLAILAVVLAVVSGPISLVLGFLAAGLGVSPDGSALGGLVVAGVCLLLPVAGLWLGLLALRGVETRPRTGGRALAMTGTTTALVGVLWGLAVAVMLLRKWFQD